MFNFDIIKKNWDGFHRNMDIGALSGCLYDETIDFLQVREYIVPKAMVLEMGVGLGYVTKDLSKRCFVSALDISDIALNRVKSYCNAVYNVKDIEDIPYNTFDLILCHNLIQHIPTELLMVELKHIIRSLKSTGILAMEFVSTNTINEPDCVLHYENVGCYCRTPEFMENLIHILGGKSKMIVNKQCSVNGVTGCHVFHVWKNVE